MRFINLSHKSKLCSLWFILLTWDTLKVVTAEYSSSGSPAWDQLINWAATKNPRLSPYASNKRGVNVPSLTSSLTVGKNGPVLLSDVNLVDSLSNFVRERIPERVVHAKGGGAYGYFEVTNDITAYTKASVFSHIGKKTPVFARFSTTSGESGSPDSVRDNLGFSVKFYTDVGNWNFAGCNMPAFRINDPIFFPSMIHAVKRNPQTHLRNPIQIWDFFSSRPESTLNLLMTYSDAGIPAGFRFINGFSIHTYKLVNTQGQIYYARFNFLTDQGIRNLTSSEAAKLSATNPDYNIEDLYNAIARAEYPSWSLYLQILTVEQVKNAPFNFFDLTKLLPVANYPFIPVGRFVLNRNPLDYFSEVESSAFSPADLIPGIEMSEQDRMIHARSFSYRDASRYRLGSNFDQLQVNKPKNFQEILPYSYMRDGQCNEENYGGGPNYFPNSFDGPGVDPKAKESTFFVSGVVDRYDTQDEDNFSQAKLFLNSLSPAEVKRVIENLGHSLRKVPVNIQQRQLNNFEQVDATFAANLRNYISSLSQAY